MKTIKKTPLTLNYHLVKRALPGRPGKYGYGAAVVSPGELDFDELCRIISERSSLCESDVVQVIQALLTNATMRLMQSEAFTLGPLGYLTSAIKCESVDRIEELDASKLRGAHCVYMPSPEMRRILGGIAFKQVRVMPPIPHRRS